MAFTQSNLDNLKAAYAEGVLEVEEDGRRVKYASGREILARITFIEQELKSQGQISSSVMEFERN